jgi:hypothetical protein
VLDIRLHRSLLVGQEAEVVLPVEFLFAGVLRAQVQVQALLRVGVRVVCPFAFDAVCAKAQHADDQRGEPLLPV